MKKPKLSIFKILYMLKDIRFAIKETIDVYKQYSKCIHELRVSNEGRLLCIEVEEARQSWSRIFKIIKK